jgi:predicted anti-sigma-YlaC factor YlaD
MPGGNEFTVRGPMTCEEFALACLDFRSIPEGSPVRLAVLEHLQQCPQCAALHENFQTLQDDLRYWGLEAKHAETPSRVEMRLMQEFRSKHKTEKTRRTVLTGSWAIAAAAAIVAAVSWTSWRHDRGLSAFGWKATTTQIVKVDANRVSTVHPAAGLEIGDALVASSTSGDFTLLPGSTPSPMEDATVVRVEMQRSALGAFGFTVNEEQASDLIQVDLLVGDDGLPQAVRLPESTE